MWQWQGSPRAFTSQGGELRNPAFSQDSLKLAFIGSDGSLWCMNLSTMTEWKLGSRFASGSYGNPTWLASNELAYTLYSVIPPNEDSDIYSYSFGDGKQKALIRHTGSQDYPSASPSGDRLAYMSSVTTTVVGLGTTITQQLWVADLRTGKVEQLTVGGSRDTHPSWSPDAKTIAFSSDRDGQPEIWTIDLATRKLTKLTKGKGDKTDPCWSPDGKQILYVTTATGKRSLELFDVATGQTKPLNPFGDKDIEIRDPAWGR